MKKWKDLTVHWQVSLIEVGDCDNHCWCDERGECTWCTESCPAPFLECSCFRLSKMIYIGTLKEGKLIFWRTNTIQFIPIQVFCSAVYNILYISEMLFDKKHITRYCINIFPRVGIFPEIWWIWISPHRYFYSFVQIYEPYIFYARFSFSVLFGGYKYITE